MTPAGIAAQHLERAEADAGRRVARLRLDDDVLARHRRRGAPHLVDLIGRGHHQDALGAARRPATRATVAPSSVSPPGEHGKELLGALLARRRPQPRPAAARHDEHVCVACHGTASYHEFVLALPACTPTGASSTARTSASSSAATRARSSRTATTASSSTRACRSRAPSSTINIWALRPTPEFQHWLPLAQPDCALLVRPGQRPKLVWTQPPNFWEKPAAPDSDFWLAQFDIVVIEDAADARAHLHPSGKLAFVGEETRRASTWGIGDANPPDADEGARPPARAQDAVRDRRHRRGQPHRRRRPPRGARRLLRRRQERARPAPLCLSRRRRRTIRRRRTRTSSRSARTPPRCTTSRIASRRARAPPSRCSSTRAPPATATAATSRAPTSRARARPPTRSAICSRAPRRCSSGCAPAPSPASRTRQLHEEAHRQVGEILAAVGVAKIGAEEVVATGLTPRVLPARPRPLARPRSATTSAAPRSSRSRTTRSCATPRPSRSIRCSRSSPASTSSTCCSSPLRHGAHAAPRRLEARRRPRQPRRHPHRGRRAGARRRPAQLHARPPGLTPTPSVFTYIDAFLFCVIQ